MQKGGSIEIKIYIYIYNLKFSDVSFRVLLKIRQDIVLCRIGSYVSSAVNPGFYSHQALVRYRLLWLKLN